MRCYQSSTIVSGLYTSHVRHRPFPVADGKWAVTSSDAQRYYQTCHWCVTAHFLLQTGNGRWLMRRSPSPPISCRRREMGGDPTTYITTSYPHQQKIIMMMRTTISKNIINYKMRKSSLSEKMCDEIGKSSWVSVMRRTRQLNLWDERGLLKIIWGMTQYCDENIIVRRW